jgi:hypothetical protein
MMSTPLNLNWTPEPPRHPRYALWIWSAAALVALGVIAYLGVPL